ncbi:F-box protein [Endozoicomonas sp. ONNA1]|uniref:F-box protein n=2 Tax=unclassified Endozoicomonas TaxID=2644528 RepID=UPI002148176A|nr:F-box protein [Endozoicomonas sp. ONNA1]
MDGLTGRKINEPAPDIGAPANPANRAKQDAPSNIVEVSDVIPKLSSLSIAVTVPDKTRIVSSTDSATAMTCYDLRWAALPREVLEIIASYLSIEDLNNFGQTSTTMSDRLSSCGLEEVHHFLSLSRQRQTSCRTIIQSSHLLLEYLRTLSIFSVRHFPVQQGPAFYSFYASHLRQQILDGTTLSLIPSGVLEVRQKHHLRDHIPFVIEKKSDNYSDILAPGPDGQWVREAEITHDYLVEYHHQQADHILFVEQPFALREGPFPYNYTGKEHFLSVYERKNDAWVEQQLTSGEIFPECQDKQIFRIRLSPDAKSAVCINMSDGVAILGRGADGQWINRGNINTSLYPRLFSPDSNHLALYDGPCIKVMSRAKDDSWSQTGDIVVTNPADDLKETPSGETVSDFDYLRVVFSPDNRHFATWFEEAGHDSHHNDIQRRYFFVVIFARDPQGQWREKERIVESCNRATRYFTLKPEFSLDGRLLIITTRESIDIWELTDDQWHKSAQKKPRSGGGEIQFSVDPCEFIRSCNQSVTIWRKAASGIWGETQTFPAESLVESSPNGETIVCNDRAGHTDIYQRKPFAETLGQPFVEPAAVEWVNQRIGFSIIGAGFNQEGCLLAVIPKTGTHSLILFGLTAEGSWLERARLQTEGRIFKFCFSPCSRTLQVRSLCPPTGSTRGREFFSLWQIMPDKVTQMPEPGTSI